MDKNDFISDREYLSITDEKEVKEKCQEKKKEKQNITN